MLVMSFPISESARATASASLARTLRIAASYSFTSWLTFQECFAYLGTNRRLARAETAAKNAGLPISELTPAQPAYVFGARDFFS